MIQRRRQPLQPSPRLWRVSTGAITRGAWPGLDLSGIYRDWTFLPARHPAANALALKSRRNKQKKVWRESWRGNKRPSPMPSPESPQCRVRPVVATARRREAKYGRASAPQVPHPRCAAANQSRLGPRSLLGASPRSTPRTPATPHPTGACIPPRPGDRLPPGATPLRGGNRRCSRSHWGQLRPPTTPRLGFAWLEGRKSVATFIP